MRSSSRIFTDLHGFDGLWTSDLQIVEFSFTSHVCNRFFFPLQVHSDHHQVVADLVQTSFLFSIPMDGPMSFSTRYVSIQWALRFEFLTTPKNVDWTRYRLLDTSTIFHNKKLAYILDYNYLAALTSVL